MQVRKKIVKNKTLYPRNKAYLKALKIKTETNQNI